MAGVSSNPGDVVLREGWGDVPKKAVAPPLPSKPNYPSQNISDPYYSWTWTKPPISGASTDILQVMLKNIREISWAIEGELNARATFIQHNQPSLYPPGNYPTAPPAYPTQSPYAPASFQ